jgi:hypothetical protein
VLQRNKAMSRKRHPTSDSAVFQNFLYLKELDFPKSLIGFLACAVKELLTIAA